MAHAVLLIENDPETATALHNALGEIGVTVWHAESGADARKILKDARPDLMILNLRLPDVDGLVLCASLRNEAFQVPFMICSTGTTAEKVLSFKLGAEDFVAKPFDIAEVQARVEAILARHAAERTAAAALTAEQPAAEAGPTLGRLRVDLPHWRVTLDDKPLTLTPTEFQLLAFMARRPGEIISRQELAQGVWGDQSMSRSRTIDAYVRRIANKLSGSHQPTGDNGSPRILNIRGMGYQLSLPHAGPA